MSSIANYSLYNFVLMLVEFRNAPSTLRQKITFAKKAIKWQFALVFSDLIVVLSRSASDHIDHVRNVLFLYTQCRSHHTTIDM